MGWIRLKKNGLATLGFKRYTVLYICLPIAVNGCMRLIQTEQQSILKPKFS